MGLLVARLSSRPERGESLPSRNLLSAEWRDPEDVSFAMRLQGVLPRSPVATTQSRRKNSSKWIAFHLASNLAPNCCSGEDDRDKGREGLPETASLHSAPKIPVAHQRFPALRSR